MILDSFMFSHEFHLLQMRFELLDSMVDKFIIVESDYSFTSTYKGHLLKDYREMYPKFKGKICYIPVHCPGNPVSPFTAERPTRNFLLEYAQKNFKGDDILIHSDLDEIPRMDVLEKMIEKSTQESKAVFCAQDFFTYYLNLRHPKIGAWERGPFVSQLKDIDKPLYKMRDEWWQGYSIIPNGGWHFSNLLPIHHVEKKINYYSHAPEFTDNQKSREGLLARIAEKKQLASDDTIFQKIDFNEENYNKWFIDNREKLKYLILE